jgi:hypothetical protein
LCYTVSEVVRSGVKNKEVGEMRPGWLLLAVGVICLMVLAPATALSQEGTEIACGSAVIDGTVGTAEWGDATVLPMKGYYGPVVDSAAVPRAVGGALAGQVHPSNGEEADGWLYLKNDKGKLYVGTTMDIGDEDSEYWVTCLHVLFTDEPCGDPGAWVNHEWEASACADMPGEGMLSACEEHFGAIHETEAPEFGPVSQEGSCADYEAQGVVAKAGQHTIHHEMSIDLEGSELNCVAPRDCLRFYVHQWEDYCPASDPECPNAIYITGYADWPAGGILEELETFGTICLNPCEAEFVPEPATMLLLGSGLLSLAGYAGLRWRTRE